MKITQQVYCDDAVSRSAVVRWHTTFFARERDSLEDDVRTGRPQIDQTERKIVEVAMLVRANRSQTIEVLAPAVGVSHGIYATKF